MMAKKYVKVLALPLVLIFLFVLQNLAFNWWLDLYSKKYFLRLFLSAFALGVLIYGPALFFRKKTKYIYLFLSSFLVSVIFTAQFLFYKYSQCFLQFSAIKYINQAESVVGTIKVLLTPEILLFSLNFILVLIIFITFGKNSEETVLPKWEKAAVLFFMLLVSFFGYKHLLDTEKKEWGNTSRLYADVYDLNALVGKMGVMNFFAEDTFKYVLRSNLVSEDDKNFLQNFAENRIIEPSNKKYFGTARGKNLIIIQVESLENVVMNKEITPNLDKLAKEGLYFNNYFAQAGPGNTADAEFCTMTSLYPLANDVVFINYAKNNYIALPEILKNNGYKTYSLHGDVPTFWNRSNIYPGLGYEKVYSLEDFTITRPVGKGPSDLGDEDLFSQSLPILENFNQPFMATLITMTSHTPFILPEDLQTLKIPEDGNFTENQKNYMQSIHYTDRAIGEFIEKLKQNGLFENSLIFILGDHESYTGISSGFLASNVPMIILAPGTDLKGETNIPSSHLDVFPTILNLLGIEAPKQVLGKDLLNTENPVETHFKLVSGGIDAILTKNMQYLANKDGIFEHGTCKSLPNQEFLPIENCKNLYSEQLNILKASNIIIKGNLLNVLTK